MHNHRARAGLLIVSGTVLLIAALLVAGRPSALAQEGGVTPTPPAPGGDNGYCLICHAQPTQAMTLPNGAALPLAVDAAALAASVHGMSNPDGPLGCLDCHAGYTYPHQQPPAADLRAYHVQASVLCVDCHREQRSVQNAANLFHGVHHEQLAANDLDGPVCVDCHGAHDVQPPDVTLPELSPRCGNCHQPEQDLCARCHEELFVRWQSGVHAIAFVRETFRQDWEARGQPDDCLTCHTTGYHADTGAYLAEDVTCSACHGYYAAGHPPAGLVVAPEPRMCGDCHVVTFEEWGSSAHAFTQEMGPVGCAVCHDPHGQQVRFEDVNALCLNCHQTPLTDYAHTSHLNVRDMTCVQCHMHPTTETTNQTQLAALVPPDHDIAGHRMTVEPEACNACHQNLQERLAAFADIGDTGALVAERDALQARVNELQAEIAERQTPPAEPPESYAQLTQGLIVGLGLSVTVGLILLRRANGGKKNGGPPPERR